MEATATTSEPAKPKMNAKHETIRVKMEADKKAADEFKAKRQSEAKAAKAPKKQKLNKWVDGFVMGAPTGMNEDETVIEILEKFEAFKKWAKTKIETL